MDNRPAGHRDPGFLTNKILAAPQAVSLGWTEDNEWGPTIVMGIHHMSSKQHTMGTPLVVSIIDLDSTSSRERTRATMFAQQGCIAYVPWVGLKC